MAKMLDKNLAAKVAAAGKPVQREDGSWPNVDAGEWPFVKAVSVCTTTGCPVEGIGFEVTLYLQIDGSLQCVCGRCGVTVTDLRGDMTPVNRDKLEELRANPKLLWEKQRQFDKTKKQPLRDMR
jgi:hypothetical protein